VNLRKTFFILPNLFTLSSVFCGFFAITLCAGEPSIDAIYQAAVAICFGFFFDLADGRVARLTKTQTNLGRELDSLADVISFGVAPALLVYKWGLSHFGMAGIFIAFLYVAAAALRLARFNVLAMQKDTASPPGQAPQTQPPDQRLASAPARFAAPGKFILGLPVPASSAVLVSLVLLNHQLAGSFVDVGQPALAVLVVVLSYLMVSRIRFRSFKDLRLSRRTLTGFAAIAAFTVVVIIGHMHSAFIFVALMATYLGLGLTEEVFFYRRRREEELAAKDAAVKLTADGGAHSDEEVLAELGAFDDDEEARRDGDGLAPSGSRR
jgi:CDP-diacylglycerol--serine O-phosphatidyltransferase